MPEKLRGSVQPLSSFTLQEEKLCLTDVQRAPEASSCEAVNRERARRAPESSMVYYNVSMQHTEKTFEKLAHMQYDLFCKSNLVVRSMLGMGAVVLGVGRAMGETMAVIMVAGNQPRMPKGILQGIRTLTGNIVIEMGYATGLHREALIATGVVLFAFILIINLAFSALKRRDAA